MSNTTTMFDYKGEIFSGRELLAIEVGREIEQERIIKLWEQEMACKCEDPMNHLVALIKGDDNA